MDKIPQFLARYLWISGRSTRQEWWLVHFLAAIALVKNEMSLLDHTAPGPNGEPVLAVPFTWLVTNFVLLWISFASIVRRLHDRDKSGWWAVLYLLPFVGWVWLVIECGFLPGRPSRWAAEDPAPVVPKIEEKEVPAPMPARTIGAVQRREYRPWNGKLLMKVARNAVGLVLAAVVGYMFLHALPDGLDGTFEMPGKTKTIE
jgi:uncharacterized membrane protein YhaH (DUF805 family)